MPSTTLYPPKSYEVVVVGAGHAGIEAALAAARMGCSTLLLTMNLDTIGHMPCNCSIGGPAKGHVVREIDALGGEMGRAIDATLTHIRMLNTSKGPAVRALRAQADKNAYHQYMKHTVERQRGLHVKQAAVESLIVEVGRVRGLRTKSGLEYAAGRVIMTTGTFLRGLTHMGESRQAAGRAGEAPSVEASACLERLGIRLGRLKTGTTARVDKKTVDFSRVEAQESEPDVPPFSFMNPRVETPRPLLPAWLTYTTDATHRIIRDNLHRSAMYAGRITGVGPRYCPSIEDKVVRFPDRDRHSVFLEQEGWDTVELYVQGMSTSLPEEVQIAFLRTLPGLEEVEVMRPGYAVEYDFVPPDQLLPTLETKAVAGLYFAGQVNGTSGYEEAAGQGVIAGMNAALAAQGREPVILTRDQSYIGVMVDDLVTKGVDDPYRLLTSRAEHRLLLRQDNADERLTPVGRDAGLVEDARWDVFHVKQQQVRREAERLRTTWVRPDVGTQAKLAALGEEPLSKPVTLAELLRRSGMDYTTLAAFDEARPELPPHVTEQVAVDAKYEGYIVRQREQVERGRKAEGKRIPSDFDYRSVKAMSAEGRDKLSRVKPFTLGQAGRIPGVTPSDVSVLAVWLEARERKAREGSPSCPAEEPVEIQVESTEKAEGVSGPRS